MIVLGRKLFLLSKIHKKLATRAAVLAQLCTKAFAGWGFIPNPTRELTTPQTPQLHLGGVLLGQVGKGKEGEGREELRARKGGEKEGREGRERGSSACPLFRCFCCLCKELLCYQMLLAMLWKWHSANIAPVVDVIENELIESWKTMEFHVLRSWSVLENSAEISVRCSGCHWKWINRVLKNHGISCFTVLKRPGKQCWNICTRLQYVNTVQWRSRYCGASVLLVLLSAPFRQLYTKPRADITVVCKPFLINNLCEILFCYNAALHLGQLHESPYVFLCH